MVANKNKSKRVYRLNKNLSPANSHRNMGLKYHLLGQSSGYPAADYNFDFIHPHPLIIMEQNEENSSLEQ